ncbi:hypothetical protein ACHAXT_003493 [Thalassiosira profunda]
MRHQNARRPPQPTITLSFRPTKLKLFRSKNKSLLVVEGRCVNGARNRIRPGQRALVHLRPSTALPLGDCNLGSIEQLANELLDDKESEAILQRGCWVDADATKLLAIKADAHIERNRRGDRLVECTALLALQEEDNEGSYLPIDTTDEYNEFLTEDGGTDVLPSIDAKSERHVIFARWLVDTYTIEALSRGSGVIDVAGGNGTISRTLCELGVPSTLLDPNPRCGGGKVGDGDESGEEESDKLPFGVIPHPLNGDGGDLTSRGDEIGRTLRNCSLLCGLHPDQATEPILALALQLGVPFAVVPCCVMPSLFPGRVQRRYNNDPVRSYSAFCRYLLDMAPLGEEFRVDHLPFVGRNKVIFRCPQQCVQNNS